MKRTNLIFALALIVQNCLPVGAAFAPRVNFQEGASARPKAGGDAQNLVNQAQELMRARQFDRAAEILRAAVRLQPNLTAAHVQLGSALLGLGETMEALASMQHAVGLNAADPAAHLGLGNAYQALRRFPESIDAYKQAIRLNPNYFGAYNNLGTVYGITNQFPESGDAFKQALRLDPSSADAHNGMAIALYRTARREEGIAELKEAIRLRPNFVNAYLNLARWYNDLGRYEESIEAFTPVTKIVPRFPTTYFERGVNYMYLGRGAEAANDARTFLEINDWHRERAPYMVIFAVIGYRQAERDADAQQFLDLAAKRCNTQEWPYPIISYLNRETTADELFVLAGDRNRMTEARAYVGLDLLGAGRRDEALAHLRWVSENGNKTFVEYTMARMELKRQGVNPL